MKFEKIDYNSLNARQQEIYNFQKIASVLADYGFNCIKLADDWQGADFLAYHKDGTNTLRVQLKGRLTIGQKYMGKELYMAFPLLDGWCLLKHDFLVSLASVHTPWLNTKSWKVNGLYSSANPSKKLCKALEPYILQST